MRVAILAGPRDFGCPESAWWVYFAGNPMQRSPASTTGIRPFSYNIRLLYKAAAVAATLRTAAGDLPVVIFSVSSCTQARTSCAFQQFNFRETAQASKTMESKKNPTGYRNLLLLLRMDRLVGQKKISAKKQLQIVRFVRPLRREKLDGRIPAVISEPKKCT